MAMESGMLLSYVKEYERMAHMLASQEFYIGQYQENLHRLYWESAAHNAHMLPQIQKCSGQILISPQDTSHFGLHDLSRDSEKKSHMINEEKFARLIASAQEGTTGKLQCRCPFCGKNFSRPWMLTGKKKPKSFEENIIALLKFCHPHKKTSIESHRGHLELGELGDFLKIQAFFYLMSTKFGLGMKRKEVKDAYPPREKLCQGDPQSCQGGMDPIFLSDFLTKMRSLCAHQKENFLICSKLTLLLSLVFSWFPTWQTGSFWDSLYVVCK